MGVVLGNNCSWYCAGYGSFKMTPYQKLFSSSQLFDEFLNFPELMRGGLFKEETREFRSAIAETYNDWQACLNETVKSGQAFDVSTLGAQDVFARDEGYNPNVSKDAMK
jgi:hypothetical protein